MAELATLSNESSEYYSSCPALNPQVDFVTESYKINWFGQQRLGAIPCALGALSPRRPSAVIMMTGTSGRSALALGKSSRPLIPGMLMSERIRIERPVCLHQ